MGSEGRLLFPAGLPKPFFRCELAAEVSACLVLAAPLCFEGDAGVAGGHHQFGVIGLEVVAVPEGLATRRTVRVPQLGRVSHSVTVEPIGCPGPRSRAPDGLGPRVGQHPLMGISRSEGGFDTALSAEIRWDRFRAGRITRLIFTQRRGGLD